MSKIIASGNLQETLLSHILRGLVVISQYDISPKIICENNILIVDSTKSYNNMDSEQKDMMYEWGWTWNKERFQWRRRVSDISLPKHIRNRQIYG